MRSMILTALTGALLFGATAAQAQGFGFEDRRRDRIERFERGDRFDRGERFERRGRFDRGVDREVIVRERGPRFVVRPPRARTVCTTRVQERITPSGRIVRRPVEVCRQRFGGLGI